MGARACRRAVMVLAALVAVLVTACGAHSASTRGPLAEAGRGPLVNSKMKLSHRQLERRSERAAALQSRVESAQSAYDSLVLQRPSIHSLFGLREALRMYDSNIPEIPQNVSLLTELETLELYDAGLTSVPPELGKLTKLQSLDLSGNQLAAVPMELGHLTNLEVLRLNGNKLTAVPPDLGKLRALTWLDLSGNNITTLPADLSDLAELQELDLSGNHLTTVPESFSRLRSLRVLDLSDNNISRPPSNIKKWKLAKLDGRISLRNNSISCDCTLQEWFKSLDDLEFFADRFQILCGPDTGLKGQHILGGILAFDRATCTPPTLNLTYTTTSTSAALTVLTPKPQVKESLVGMIATTRDGLEGLHSTDVAVSNFYSSRDYDTNYDTNYGTGYSSELLPDNCAECSPGQWPMETACMDVDCIALGFFIRATIDDQDVAGLCCYRYDSMEWIDGGENLLIPMELTGLKPATRYTLMAQTVLVMEDGTAGYGTPSIAMEITTRDTPPNEPTNVTVSPERETAVTIEWDPPSLFTGEITSYTIECVDLGDSKTCTTDNACLNNHKLEWSGLVPGTRYTFRVKAATSAGEGPFSSVATNSTLAVCEFGSERDNESNECTPCPENTFGTGTALERSCERCPKSSPVTNGTGAVSEDACLAIEGTFVHDSTVYRCADIDGVTCPAAGFSLDTLQLDTGYWRGSLRTMVVKPCRNEAFCTPAIESLEPYCAPGHTGVTCLACIANYSMSSTGCVECSGDVINEHAAAFRSLIACYAAIVVAPSFVVVALYLTGTCKPACAAGSTGRLHTWWFLRHGVKMRSLIGFVQVLFQFTLTVSRSLEADMPSWLDFVANLDISGLFRDIHTGCHYQATYFRRMAAYALFPLMAIGCILLQLCLVLALARKDLNLRHAFKSNTLWVTSYLLLFTCVGVCSAIVRVWIFDEFQVEFESNENAIQVLAVDWTEDVTEGISMFWTGFSAGILTLYVTGPVAFFGLCAVLYHREIDADGGDKEAEVEGVNPSSLANKRSVEAVAFLSAPYRPKMYAWEAFEMIRKVSLSLSYLVLSSYTSNTFATAFFLCTIGFFIMSYTTLRPFNNAWDGFFAQGSLVILGMAVTAMSAVSDRDGRDSADGPFIVCVTALAVEVLLLAGTIYIDGKRFAQESVGDEQEDYSSSHANTEKATTDDRDKSVVLEQKTLASALNQA